jgi:hypothetical protein
MHRKGEDEHDYLEQHKKNVQTHLSSLPNSAAELSLVT